MALLRLLDFLRAVKEDLIGVWYVVDFAAAELSAVISTMMSSWLFFSVVVRVTLVTTT